MNADHYYEIGSSHFSCEDYALSGQFAHAHYALIADGCSSSDGSEVGARILAHVAKEALRQYHTELLLYRKDSDEFRSASSRFRQHIVSTIGSLHQQLGLCPTALDATLLIALSSEKKSLVFVYGDGNVLFTLVDGTKGSYCVDFDNTPYYLSYWLDPVRRAGYLGAFHCGDNLVTITQDGEEPEMQNSQQYEIKDFDYDLCCFDFGSDLHTVSVASDGLETYQQKQEDFTLKDVPLNDVIAQVGAYKNFKGEFVKRRMNGLKKKCLKSNTTHDDDVSIATIFINPIVEV